MIGMIIKRVFSRTITNLGLYRLFADEHKLINFFGGKIYINRHESSMMRDRWLNIYEWSKTNVFKKTVKPGMVFIDVGANKGYFSLISSKLMKGQGHVYSIEPSDKNIAWLNKSIKANGYTNITAHQVAMWHSDSKMTLYYGKK